MVHSDADYEAGCQLVATAAGLGPFELHAQSGGRCDFDVVAAPAAEATPAAAEVLFAVASAAPQAPALAPPPPAAIAHVALPVHSTDCQVGAIDVAPAGAELWVHGTVNAPGHATVTIGNVGCAPIRLQNICLVKSTTPFNPYENCINTGPMMHFGFSAGGGPGMLAPGQTRDIAIAYAPADTVTTKPTAILRIRYCPGVWSKYGCHDMAGKEAFIKNRHLTVRGRYLGAKHSDGLHVPPLASLALVGGKAVAGHSVAIVANPPQTPPPPMPWAKLRWQLLERPVQSRLWLRGQARQETTSAVLRFVPDVPGKYTFAASLGLGIPAAMPHGAWSAAIQKTIVVSPP